MKNTYVILLTILLGYKALANDGVFYAQGNQLVPITETEISVQKEILTVNRVGNHLEVDVYYEFFNPTDRAKDLLVGFEAAPAYPYEGMEDFPEQPHMRHFKVLVNGRQLSYRIAHVSNGYYDEDADQWVETPYYADGKFKALTRKQCEEAIAEYAEMSYPFNYVYHFNARFQPGVNIVRHTYEYDMSMSVDQEFFFPYVLTAACRWAGGQIGDFTLRINMGDHESFAVEPTFFADAADWSIDGVGKAEEVEIYGEKQPMFHLRKGGISFSRNNFRPEGELRISKPQEIWSVWSYGEPVHGADVVAASRGMYIDWSILLGEELRFTDAEQRIMRNLPFAWRGYVFKSKDLQKYFESTTWYIPDPDYVADMEALPEKEQAWILFWSKYN